MKVTREQAEANRERVVDTAAKLFRERGYGGIGVADLMKNAGLTHGGFYGQFGSKDALLAEAVSHATERSVASWNKIVSKHSDDPLAALTAAYLSPLHRDNCGEGCTIAALGPELARQGPAVRAAVTEGVQQQIARLAALMPAGPDHERRQGALVTFASMVGAMIMARAVSDQELSDEFLSAVHGAITGM